jgi:hypothetical protein
VAFKYFNVKNGLVTGNILLHAGNGVIAANTFNGSLDVTDSANLGNVRNIKITGGQANYVLQTDGTGNLSWVEQSGGGSQVAGSNTQVQFNNNGNFSGSNTFTFDSSNTLLTVNNFVATSSANLGNIANIKVTGGSNGYYLQTDGTGNLTWANVTTGITLTVDDFVGDGTNTAYTLTQTPDNANYTMVSIGGVMQPKSVYTVIGNVLTFSSAPPETAPIEVTTFASGGSGGGGGGGTPGGETTQIQFNDDGEFSGNIGLTFNKTTQTLTATLLSGNGSGLSNINGSNVSGAVANATYATSAGTANSVALANVSGAGNIAAINLNGNTSQVLYGNGVFASAPVSYGNANVATFLSSYGSNTLTTTGNVSVGNLTASGISNLGPVSNVRITGGTANFVLRTDGVGNLSWVAQTTAITNIPPNDQSAAYVLVASDVGKYINITAGGVTVPSGVFSSGDTLSIYNNSASNQTITQGASVTMYQVGTATTGNRTLAQRGLATLLCVGSNQFVITGGGLT